MSVVAKTLDEVRALKAHEKRERKRRQRAILQLWEQYKRGKVSPQAALTRLTEITGA